MQFNSAFDNTIRILTGVMTCVMCNINICHDVNNITKKGVDSEL